MLLTLVALLGAATITVPLSRWMGFGSVLGYLVAGLAIGPQAFGLVGQVDQIAGIAQLGVIMLLFLIGLELRPQRLWVMRKAVFGLGPAQVAVTGGALAVLGHLAGGLDWAASSVIGVGFALSSTAIVLPMLAERDLLGTRAGRDTFAVLLFQDLAFIPLVAILPTLAGGDVPDRVPWLEVARGAAAIAIILGGGRFLLNPLLRLVAGLKTPEVFTATALLIVVGAAALCEAAGLSMSLGAFLAGVLLSDSDYRHELRADIEPFEGLLLGFFFISVGMEVDLHLAIGHPGALILGVLALIATKLVIASGVGLLSGEPPRDALRFGLALPQGSEFSFVLFGAAVASDALAPDVSAFATLVVAASIVMTPILFATSEKFIIPRFARKAEPVYDALDGAEADIIICGFGRVGQIVGRILHLHRIPFTALEKDPGQVDVVRRVGRQVFFGDPSRADVLRAAGAGSAKLLIVALAGIDETVATVEMARREFPHLKILARARNRFHAHLLMDRAVDGFVRETFYSSLRLSEMVLTELGIAKAEAAKAVELFAEYDEKLLLSTHAIYRNETKVIQTLQQATRELEELFDQDQQETRKAAE